ncbi:hypothetical protein CROQUDRAFT_669496 [Cronartium quercuum f. sp. fusiforme G11]|uniref:Rrn7/TAF1B N-terminal cyclin domain-containing protein n=1 Tax=Cronartium quercuum f. sp. fusiforme G11 TaxID=708437 RepID=A0A9P6NNX3_9BASI|nr:hypothetical protein CROQUDRAFT_669496 [Cronartium quercuum f. sp. fusiforme G11]
MSQNSSQAPTPSGHSQSGSRKSQRPACARCGSRRWRRENNRGVLICSEGHVLEGHLRESTEQTEASQHSTRVRRIKVGKTRKEYYVLYRGEHSRLLLLQIFTILIRKQAEALIEVLQAPAVLEEVVHAFWRAYLTTLSLDTNLLLSSRPSSTASTSHFAESQSGYSSDESRWSNARHGSQSHPTSPTRSFPDDPGVSLTPEALKAMTENESDSSDESDSSRPDQGSQSDDDSQRTPQPGNRRRWQRHDNSIWPRIECTLGILYLACIRLRLPIIMQDLINLVITKDLPYIGFLATIPEYVKAKMSLSLISHLSILNPPRIYSFHGHSLINICHKLATRLRRVDPSLLPIAESVPNISSIILRFSQIFILPSPIHALALHMISRLKPEYLRLSNSSNASSTTPRSRSRTNTENTRFPTDWFVMASLVTTIKIVLDGVHKHCLSHSLFQLFRKSLPPPKEWMAAIISLRDSVELKNPQRLCE